ncbi:MarR family winged helix-turn-helix transcriptional regulator [Oceanobacillus salinisoli]|uniref:MarR family winged helix-turn-helix transcriptional regulator n=1 Tax=Oceanobacillus salinisoli TaxID=2678611 RepID=UPI001E4CCAC5|nr:MarR family transcriptional regulator [Oceanobacillus salinisoli]
MGRGIEEKIGYQIGVVAHLFQNHYNQQLAKYDVTIAQARVLYLLVEQGPQSQGELQQQLYIKGSTMNGIIESLLNKELIEKSENQHDKRSKMISLTEKGRFIDQRLWDDMATTEDRVLKGFTKEEIALMRLWLGRIKSNIVKIKEEE